MQFGHGWIWTKASARCERRRPFLDFDSLTFGCATAAEVYRNRLPPLDEGRSDRTRAERCRGGARCPNALPVSRLFAGLLACRHARLQSLDAPTDGGNGTAEVRLELLQLLERV